jgi:hypothetical protein
MPVPQRALSATPAIKGEKSTFGGAGLPAEMIIRPRKSESEGGVMLTPPFFIPETKNY